MSLLLPAVPALLVVVAGYALGYHAWAWIGGPGEPETVGWVTGGALLVVVTRILVTAYRRRRGPGRDGAGV